MNKRPLPLSTTDYCVYYITDIEVNNARNRAIFLFEHVDILEGISLTETIFCFIEII